jgi:hypothetical protein
MQHAARALIAVLVLILLYAPAPKAAERLQRKPSRSSDRAEASTAGQQTKPMTVWQARRVLTATLNGVKFRAEGLEYWGCKWDLRTQPTLRVAEYYKKGRFLGSNHDPTHYYYLSPEPGCLTKLNQNSWDTRQQAQALADALNPLSAYARGERTPEAAAVWSDFPQKTAAWRALAVKPPLAEEVRKHRILAEKAFSEKDLYGAVEEYEAGLAIDPMWPEGHFNAALLCGELKVYAEAIRYMHAYVELVPNGSDTQSARDQMIIWEAELTKTE